MNQKYYQAMKKESDLSKNEQPEKPESNPNLNLREEARKFLRVKNRVEKAKEKKTRDSRGNGIVMQPT